MNTCGFNLAGDRVNATVFFLAKLQMVQNNFLKLANMFFWFEVSMGRGKLDWSKKR